MIYKQGENKGNIAKPLYKKNVPHGNFAPSHPNSSPGSLYSVLGTVYEKIIHRAKQSTGRLGFAIAAYGILGNKI